MKRIKKQFYYYHRLIAVVTLTVIIVLTAISFYFIFKIDNELRKYVILELDVATEQCQRELDTKLQSVIGISDMIYSNSDLNRQMFSEFNQPYEYWEFYNYLSKVCSGIMTIDTNIELITFFIDNQSLLPDKKNIRSYNEIKSSKIYGQIQHQDGNMGFYRMKDVFFSSYFEHNNVSNPENLVFIRKLKYNNQTYVLLVEITNRIITEYFAQETNKEMYLLGSDNHIIFQYKNGIPYEPESRQLIMPKKNDNSVDSIRSLCNDWQVVSRVDTMILFSDVKSLIQQMGITGILLSAIAVFLIVLVLWKMSYKLRVFHEKIQKFSQAYGDEGSFQAPANRNEIDLAIQSFQRLMNRVDYLMEEVYKKEIENQSIELELLHSQIKPHFLYNTLSSISSLSKKYNDPQLLNMINALSDLYRISLSRGRDHIMISDEVQISKSYIYIMENRFADLIQVKFEIPNSIRDGIVPKVLLQPFIENAITHGICADRILTIEIGAQLHDGKILFFIKDDGVGIDTDTIEEIFSKEPVRGYGIRNVHQRIKILFGNSYGVTIKKNKPTGTIVQIEIPYIKYSEFQNLGVKGNT